MEQNKTNNLGVALVIIVALLLAMGGYLMQSSTAQRYYRKGYFDCVEKFENMPIQDFVLAQNFSQSFVNLSQE